MRVVLDTNIWVSGLLWRGLPWRLLRLAALSQVVPCMAPEMLGELAEVQPYERLRPRLQSLRLEAADLVSYAMSLTTFFDVPSGPINDDDVENIMLAHSPKLRKMLDEAEQRIREGGGVSHDDMRALVGQMP